MASLNRMFIVSFMMLSLFTVIFAYMPSQFFAYQTGYYNQPVIEDREVAEKFNAMDLTLYKNTWSFNISFGEMQYREGVDAGLPEGHRLEFHWHYSPVVGSVSVPVIEIRHACPSWFFGLWLDFHRLRLISPYDEIAQTSTPDLITKEALLNLAQGNNYASFKVACEHICVQFLVVPYNQSWTLSESWDNGKLHVLCSYEIDWEAMKPSAWTLLGQLLTFQAPDLGVPGIGGKIISHIVGAILWSCMILLIYAAITRLIPMVKGGLEG